MDIGDFLGIFPTSIQETVNDKAGFFLRFSTSRNKWIVGYGIQRSKRFEHHKSQVGIGDNVKEALDDLVEKIKQYNFSDKYEQGKTYSRTRMDKTS